MLLSAAAHTGIGSLSGLLDGEAGGRELVGGLDWRACMIERSIKGLSSRRSTPGENNGQLWVGNWRALQKRFTVLFPPGLDLFDLRIHVE